MHPKQKGSTKLDALKEELTAKYSGLNKTELTQELTELVNGIIKANPNGWESAVAKNTRCKILKELIKLKKS